MIQPEWPEVNPDLHDPMTRKIHKTSKVSRTESTNEPSNPTDSRRRGTHTPDAPQGTA